MRETINTIEEFKDIFRKISFENRRDCMSDRPRLYNEERNEIYLDSSYEDLGLWAKKLSTNHSFDYMCKNFFLSEEIIIQYLPYFDLDDICQYQILTEDFIRRFQEQVNWQYIFLFQETSKDIFNDFKDRVNFIDEREVVSEPENFPHEFTYRPENPAEGTVYERRDGTIEIYVNNQWNSISEGGYYGSGVINGTNSIAIGFNRFS